jgi:hypothetical protein
LGCAQGFGNLGEISGDVVGDPVEVGAVRSVGVVQEDGEGFGFRWDAGPADLGGDVRTVASIACADQTSGGESVTLDGDGGEGVRERWQGRLGIASARGEGQRGGG